VRLLKASQNESAKRDLFLQTVSSHLGYVSELGFRTKFGQRVGYDSQPWGGAFIDCCIRDSGVQNFPAFVNTSAAVSEVLRRGLDNRVPQVGDIVVFNFASMSGPSASSFNQPHCGVVVNIKEFEETGRFLTVEGNIEGATVNSKRDGVYQRIRHMTDVMIFCRPLFSNKKPFSQRVMEIFDTARTRFSKEETDAIVELVKEPLILKIKSEIVYGTRNKRVEIIQIALAMVTDLRGAETGKWDGATAAAMSRFQRNIGRSGSDVTGLPDFNALSRLSRDTNVFTIEIDN
jgi:hypothetical protein